MPTYTLIQSRTMQATLAKLHIKMRRSETEEEFQLLQKQYNSIIDQLKSSKIHYPNLSSFKDNQIAPQKHPYLHSELKNIAAISWYLIRITDKAEELNIKNLQSFRKVAQEASKILEEVQELLANHRKNA